MGATRALEFRMLVALLLLSSPAPSQLRGAACSPSVFGQAPATPVIGQVATADVNGDGRLDFAAFGPGFNRIGVRLAVGDGTFAEPVLRDVEIGVATFTLADFDGDAKPDLVTESYQRLAFFKGNGNGTFQDPIDAAVPPFFQPSAFFASDLDADGNLDLMASVGNGMLFFQGKGNGTFFAPVSAAPLALPEHFALADLDGDTFPDLVIPNGGSAEVRLGKGDGTFGDPNLFAAGPSVSSVAAADLDLDGKVDLVATVTGKVAFLKGQGDGTFLASIEQDAGTNPGDIVAADFDGDGKPDIAVTGSGNPYIPSGSGVSIFYGDGQGSFGDLHGYVSTVPARLVPGDFDADGFLDLASFAGCCPGTASVSVLRNLETRAFQAVGNVDIAKDAVLLVSADFDRDGRLDLVAGDQTGLQVLLGEKDGLFRPGITLAADNDIVAAVATADFDGDGKPDLALTRTRDFAVYLGNGDGTFREPAFYPLDSFAGAIEAADFDHDGKPDLAVAWGFGEMFQIRIFRGRGDGAFIAGPSAQPLGFLPASLTAADLNGDGIPDLVASAASAYDTPAYVSLLFSNGDGTLAPRVDLDAGDDPSGTAVGDFDEDGVLDLVVANSGSGNVSLLFGNGNGTFAPPIQIGLAWLPNRIVVADFDGDGHDDFAITSGGTVAIALGLGTGGFHSPVPYGVPNAAIPAVTGDFDQTGSPDLVVGVEARSVSVLLNTRLSVSSPAAQVVCGGADAVFSVRSSGFGPVHYEWRKDGTPLADGGSLSGTATAELRVAAPGVGDEGVYDVVVTDTCGSRTSDGASLAIAPKPVAPTIAAPSSAAPGASGLIASVIGVPGHSYSWSITGGVITAGQGTNRIAFMAGAAGTTMSLWVTEVLDAGCVSDPATALVQTDFLDVPPSHPFHDAVVAVTRAGITTGCGAGKYCPALPVSRSAMSVFILRGEHGGSYQPPAATGSLFGDVSTTTFLARWVEQLGNEGISRGCGGGNFCPQDPVNRAAMAVFLLRGRHGAAFHPSAATGSVFADVSTSTFLADWIEQLAGENIARGCGGGNYCPAAAVSRGEMAALIRRTFGL